MALGNGTSIRAVHTIHCANCGCGWFVGKNPANQPRAARIVLNGYGLMPVADCEGCACHTGIGVLPFLKVTMDE
jgi:hypothetical protein